MNLYMLKKFKKDDVFDSCVVCGARTRFTKSTPLEMRSDYLPGAGQLCPRCAAQNMDEERAAMRDGFAYELPIYEKDAGAVGACEILPYPGFSHKPNP